MNSLHQYFYFFYKSIKLIYDLVLTVQTKIFFFFFKLLVFSIGWIMEKEMVTHSSTLGWKIPWIEEAGRLQSMGLQRVRHNWATSFSFSLYFLLEKEMATHSSVLAWRIPWTEGPSLWGCKESDMPKQLTYTYTHKQCISSLLKVSLYTGTKVIPDTGSWE